MIVEGYGEKTSSGRTQIEPPATARPAPARSAAARRLAGAAGLGYVAGVSIENMEILEAPTLDSPVAEIDAFFGDQAFGIVTTAAGAAALVFYSVLAVMLFGLLRSADGRSDRWRVVGLVGGVGGPVVAAVALGATAILVANGGTGLSDDTTRSLFDVAQQARMWSGLFVALFLFGYGVAALRSRALPGPLARVACVLAPVFLVGPLAAVTQDPALGVTLAIAFGLQTLWILFTSLWLALADGVGVATFVRRAAFLVLVLAAGLIGLGLLAAPGGTGRFFSWSLEPEPLAAFAGGVYIGSAVAYGAAVSRPWQDVRGMVAAAVVLSVSVFAVSLVHAEFFDFDRLQTWAWFVLFATFAAITAGLLVAPAGERSSTGAPAPLPTWARGLLAAEAALLGALAIALWIDPVGLSDPSPFDLPPLGGRFAAAWVALLAVAASWAALSDHAEEAWLPALALVTLPAGALVAALRTLPEVEPASAVAVYIAALALLATSGLAVLGAAGKAGAR